MSKSSPPATDYNAAAQTQAASSASINAQQTAANRPNINTPFGSQTWTQTPGAWDPNSRSQTTNWTQNTSLTPASQAALDAQQNIGKTKSDTAQGLLGQFQKDQSTPIDWNSFTSLGKTPTATTTGMNPSASNYDKSAADASFNSFMGYNAPLMKQASDQMDTQLQNQGLKPGDQAYDTAMTNLRDQQSRSTQQAGYGSILTGAQIGAQQSATDLAAQNQGFGQSMAGAQYQSTQRGQQAAEAMQRQGFSLNQINGILNGQQVGLPQTPGFATAGGSQPVQALSAAQSTGAQNLNAFNANQQQQQSNEAGIASIGMALAMY